MIVVSAEFCLLHLTTPLLNSPDHLLTDSDNKLPLFGRALRSEVKMDPLEMLGKKYKVSHTKRHPDGQTCGRET